MLSQCPICHSDRFSRNATPSEKLVPDKLKSNNVRELRICLDCEVGYTYPFFNNEELSSVYKDERSEWSEEELKLGPREFPVHYSMALSRMKMIVPLLKQMTSSKKIKILDIGAGNGAFGFAAKELLPSEFVLDEYCPLDLDSRVLGHLEKYWPYPDSKIHAASNLIQLKDQKFDIVVLSHILEHLTDPGEFLKQLLPLLKLSSIVFIEVPNQDFLYKKVLFPHVVFFNEVSLIKLLKESGFSVLDHGVFGRTPKKSKQNSIFLERVVLRLRYFIPKFVLFGAMQWIYGTEIKNDNGSWLRAIGTVKGNE